MMRTNIRRASTCRNAISRTKILLLLVISSSLLLLPYHVVDASVDANDAEGSQAPAPALTQCYNDTQLLYNTNPAILQDLYDMQASIAGNYNNDEENCVMVESDDNNAGSGSSISKNKLCTLDFATLPTFQVLNKTCDVGKF